MWSAVPVLWGDLRVAGFSELKLCNLLKIAMS